MTRTEFEQFMATPRFHLSTARWPDDPTDPVWPGRYKDPAVQIAWEVLQEAQRREKEGDKK